MIRSESLARLIQGTVILIDTSGEADAQDYDAQINALWMDTCHLRLVLRLQVRLLQV